MSIFNQNDDVKAIEPLVQMIADKVIAGVDGSTDKLTQQVLAGVEQQGDKLNATVQAIADMVVKAIEARIPNLPGGDRIVISVERAAK